MPSTWVMPFRFRQGEKSGAHRVTNPQGNGGMVCYPSTNKVTLIRNQKKLLARGRRIRGRVEGVGANAKFPSGVRA